MACFFAGNVLGVLIERYHLLAKAPLPLAPCELAEIKMQDVVFMALTMGAFGLMALAIRILQR